VIILNHLSNQIILSFTFTTAQASVKPAYFRLDFTKRYYLSFNDIMALKWAGLNAEDKI